MADSLPLPPLGPRLAAGGLLVALLAVAVAIPHEGGADATRYLHWSLVFLSGDVLELGGELASPTGLPVTQWSFGPGLLLAVPDGLRLASSPSTAGIASFGVVSFALTWLGILLLLPRAVLRSPLALGVSLGLFFYGSHAGYYSHHHASESIALLLVVWLAVFLREGDPARRATALAFFTAGALLCVVRLNLAPLTGAFFLAWAFRARGTVSRRRWWTDGALALGLLLLAGAMIGTANQWMTGSFLHPPYAMGDESFRTADLTRPRFLPEILWHPWHGLLVYHPLYAVGTGLAGWRLARGRGGPEHVIALFGLAFLLWLHAGWFCWWLGTMTFGMRAVAPLAVLLLLPIAEEIAEGRGRRLAWLLVPGVAWSFLLQQQGTTNFTTWPALLAAQRDATAALVTGGPGFRPALAGAAVLASAAVAGRRGLVLPADTSLRHFGLPVASGLLALTALVASALFVHTAIETRTLLASGAQWQPGRFERVNTFNSWAVEGNLEEYERLDGYEAEKAAIRAFLERHPDRPYEAVRRERAGAAARPGRPER